MEFADYFRDTCRQQPRDLIEKWAAGSSGGVYVGDDVVLCRVLREYLMYVDGRDASISPHLIFRGMWEPWITMAIAQRVERGWRCLDVGANSGYYTLLLAGLVGGEDPGRVVAVEPQPLALNLLEKTLSVNGFSDRVSLLNCAASDKQHHGYIYLPKDYLYGGARVVEAEGSIAEGLSRIGVSCSPLDDLEEIKNQRWDFIKIDVEGAERAVMRGLKKTIEAQEHLCIAMELTPAEWEDPPGPFLDALRLQGFSVGTIQNDASIKPLDDYSTLPNEPGKWEMIWLEK